MQVMVKYKMKILFFYWKILQVLPPKKALSGLLWFDSGNNKLKFYDEQVGELQEEQKFPATTSTGLTTGDFCGIQANEQLYTFNGTSFLFSRSQGVGSSITRFPSRSIVDSGGTARPVIARCR